MLTPSQRESLIHLILHYDAFAESEEGDDPDVLNEFWNTGIALILGPEYDDLEHPCTHVWWSHHPPANTERSAAPENHLPWSDYTD